MAMEPRVTGAGLVKLEASSSRPHIGGGSKMIVSQWTLRWPWISVAGSATGLAYLGFPQPTPYGEALRKGGANIGYRKPIWPVNRGWRITLLAVDLYMIITKAYSPPNHDLLAQRLQNPSPWLLGTCAHYKTRETASAQNAVQLWYAKNLPASTSM